MVPVISFIESYGYIAVFIGSIFEGESVVLLGGLSSHEVYLSFPLVVLFATAGAIISDWTFFFLGKYKKGAIIARFPYLGKLAKTPFAMIRNKPRFISFAMRFMYGFRHVVPFSIGSADVPTRLFLLWNGFGAFLWAIVYTSVGYLVGNILEEILGDIKRYEFRIIVLAIIIVASLLAITRIIRMVLQNKNDSPSLS